MREIKEELNLEITHLTFYGTFPNTYVFEDFTYFTIDIVFNCRVKNFDNLWVGDDVAAYCFKNLNDINIDELGLDSVKNLIRALRITS
jgi:8-oxo-dGTP pyrophosphatase MutT (NUDIX family)